MKNLSREVSDKDFSERFNLKIHFCVTKAIFFFYKLWKRQFSEKTRLANQLHIHNKEKHL